jgi:hypothetical protein
MFNTDIHFFSFTGPTGPVFFCARSRPAAIIPFGIGHAGRMH